MAQKKIQANQIDITKADVGLSNVPNTDLTSAVSANTAKVTNATHTGDVTGATALTIANNAVTPAKMQGTAPTSAKYYRGDGTWNTPANTTYAEISSVDITNGTATTASAITGRRSQEIVTKARTGVELTSNKDTTTTLGTSDTLYPSQKAVKTYVDNSSTASAIGTAKYVSSQGGGLITNGTGLYENNTNFSTFTYSNTDKPTGAIGSFVTPNTSSGLLTADELISVDPYQRYKYSFSVRQVSGTGKFYGALVPIDADGLDISPSHYLAQAGTLTTLASDLVSGDTVMHLTSSANWYTGASTYQRSAIFWNYTDGNGYTWAEETYSRNISGSNFYNTGAISGNDVTLRVPYSGATVPAGTKVSNANSGSTYMYIGASNVSATSTWTNYDGYFGGGVTPSATGQSASVYLPMMATAIKAGFLVNQSGASSIQAFANINMKLVPTLDTDAGLTANSDNISASQKAVKAYTDKKGVLAYNVYTSNGTWTKPVGAKVVEVYAIGGGGGGGKGTSGATSTKRNGGGGGGAGGAVIASIDATTLGSTVSVTVGTGGAGATTDGAFSTGTAGGNTVFGSVSAGGGAGGSSGSGFLGAGGGSAGASSLMVGGGGSADANGVFSLPGTSGHVGSGAGGMAILDTNANQQSLAGGNSSAGSGGTAGGTTVAGGNGANGTGTNGGAGGGGGGGGNIGGNGGTNGGGGGGGSATLAPTVSGNGGAGGRGSCIVITYG